MNVWINGTPTEYGQQIGKESFVIDDIYDLGFLHDGTSHVVRASRMTDTKRSERHYYSLEDYEITIGLSR